MPTKVSKMMPPKGEDESGEDYLGEDDKEEHRNTLCGACDRNYATDEF